MVEFQIAPDLLGRVRVGLLVLEGVSVREGDPALDAEVDRVCASFRERYGEGKSSEVPGAADARTLYKALGLDPTKTRPSNEALLPPGAQGRDALPHQHPGGRAQPRLAARAAAVRPLRPRPGQAPGSAPQGGGGRRLRGHPEGDGERRGPARSGGRGTAPSAIPRPTRCAPRSRSRPAGPSWWPTRPSACRVERLNAVLDRTAETLLRHCGGTRTGAASSSRGRGRDAGRGRNRG